MFGIFLKIAIRQLARHPLYSAINILGLSVGLATAILILLFVRSEFAWDSFFANSDRIVRATTLMDSGTQRIHFAATAGALAIQINIDRKEDVEAAVRLFPYRSMLEHEDTKFFEDTLYADPEVFEVFDFTFIEGGETALDQPNTIVLTETTARKFFGDASALGEVFTISNQVDVKVTAVIEDLPWNSHLKLTNLVEMQTLVQFATTPSNIVEGWNNLNTYTYLLLKPGIDVQALEESMADLLNAYAPEWIKLHNFIYFEPLTGIHLYGNHQGELDTNADINDVYIFSAIAAFILLIACINFMNLTTARATVRLIEVGMRKVMGAQPGQVRLQYLGEAVVIALIALTVGVLFAWLMLPRVNALLASNMTFDLFADWTWPALLLGLGVLTGLVAGAYPALYLSRFPPAIILDGTAGGAQGSSIARKALVVFQFALSIGLMVATGIVYAQMNYAEGMDLGYDTENVVIYSGIAPRQEILDAYPAMRDAMAAHPDVLGASGAWVVPTDFQPGGMTMTPPGGDPNASPEFWFNDVDYNFFGTLGIPFIAGRDFSREYGTDYFEPGPPGEPVLLGKASIILNRSGVDRAGFASPEDAIGKVMFQTFTNDEGVTNHWDYEVIGVVEDFHMGSAVDQINPSLYYLFYTPFDYVFAKVRTGTLQETVADLDALWQQWVPNFPVTRAFLEDRYNALYDSERRRLELFTIFSGLAIFVAALGLFGLSSFTMERRRMEIGIRKIHGAGAFRIVSMIAWDLSSLVLAANLVAWPVAFYFMQAWLEGFAFRVAMSPLYFINAALLALGISWITVTMQSTKRALGRPALSLRER